MKSCDEMAESVFRKIEEYKIEKQRKRKKMTRILLPVICFCLVVILGIGTGLGGLFNSTPIKTQEDAIIPGTKDYYGRDEEDNQSSAGDNAIGELTGDTSTNNDVNEGNVTSATSNTTSKESGSSVKQGNTSSSSSTTSKESVSSVKQENTSSSTATSSSTTSNETSSKHNSIGGSNTYKNIDEVPPIVLEGEPVPFTVSGETVPYDFNLKFSQGIVRSREELLSLYEEHDFESPFKKINLFVTAKNKYGDDYFNENALILLYSRVGSSSKKHRFDCLVKKDAKLYAGILEWIPGAKDGTVSVTQDISAVCYVIEVKKSDIGGINDIELKIEYDPNIS